MLKETQNLKQKISQKGSGFGSSQKPEATEPKEAKPPVNPAVDEASQHAIQFMGAAQENIASQLQSKATFLQDLDGMLDSAATAIATAEQTILSGVSLEQKLAAKRAEYSAPVADATVSLEFEALNTLDVLAKPAVFPSVTDTVRAISPSGKARMDKAITGA